MKMGVLKWLSDKIFPENFTCELCGREIFDGGRLCGDCAKTVTFNDKNTCPVCGRRTATNALCIECKALAPKYKKAVSAIVYGDGGALLISKFKDGKAYLKDYFAELLAPKCSEFKVDGICYVPMTKSDERRRGYNQAKLLAKSLSAKLGVPLLDGAIVKIKRTYAQKTLTFDERKENLRSSFKADRSIVKGKKLLLVDDVMTSGATADVVCTELLKRGAAQVYFATAASVEYKLKTAENIL